MATGASNVIGVKADFREAFAYCQTHKIKILFDSTQTLGYEEIDWKNYPVDFLAGTGHKTLLGPTGVGFLYIKDPSILSSYVEGGSPGNNSISLEHPKLMPFKFEAGTVNALGIIGLLGSLNYIIEKTFLKIKKKL
ncbi:MAG: aminotransferase class V-fold PLP-dependent enzyme [Chlamydiales bacterium]